MQGGNTNMEKIRKRLRLCEEKSGRGEYINYFLYKELENKLD